jgi:hypothetical protein
MRGTRAGISGKNPAGTYRRYEIGEMFARADH